jgi:hypothetical protein
VPFVAACGDDGGGDIDAFCDRIGALVDDDPFQRLPDTATPADMRRAFRSLRRHATAIAAAAPDELRPVAREWARAVRRLDDLLAGSGYDAPSDQVAYEEQADAYESLRVRLENAAAQECPGITDR